MKDGFADLSTTGDLFAKLRHDRQRMSADPSDSYAAFDFFVTAEHVIDWLIPDAPGSRRQSERQAFRDSARILQITSHIASGGKHFRALSKQHTTVDDVEARVGGFDPRAFSPTAFSPSAFLFAGIHVALDDGSLVHVYTLADEVVAFWRGQLGL